MLLEIAAVAIGYLLGSVPAAYIIARLRRGIDIRDVGVRNMGAANVFREVGVAWGAIAAAADIGKGSAAVLTAQALGVAGPWVLAAGLAAIMGHNFPVFVGFRGGRGVATLIGVMLVISPLTMAIVLPVLGAVWLMLRHMFTTIVFVAPVFLVVTWLVERSFSLLIFTFVMVAFIVLRTRHRFNEIAPTVGKLKKAGASRGK